MLEVGRVIVVGFAAFAALEVCVEVGVKLLV